ncbi:MAG: acyltransferase family protein, partial [bacterium]
MFSGGYIGVDVFFVVSGFLITSLLVREFDTTNKISLTNFYARRVRRLLPASLVVVIGTLVISKIWLEPLRLNDLTQDARAAALFATNIVFAVRESDYLQSALPPSPLQHYWSLGVEEQFYIFFPIIVMVLLKLG